MAGRSSTPADFLASPGGKEPLTAQGTDWVTPSGQRFEVKDGILRTLRDVDPDLAREIECQANAVDAYSDPRLLMPRYEHHMAEIGVVKMFGGSPPTGDVLDAGCGIGLLGRLFPKLDLVGLDVSIPLLSKVTTGYRFLAEGSAEALPFRDASFDVVVALNMLHHVIDPKNAVREFARVLRPGGTLIALDPRKVWPIEVAKQLLRGSDETFAPTHKAFAVDEYKDIIESTGTLRVERYERVGLVSLVGMGGMDATKLSRFVPTPQLAVSGFRLVDTALFKLPGVEKAGLNLVVRARKAA